MSKMSKSAWVHTFYCVLLSVYKSIYTCINFTMPRRKKKETNSPNLPLDKEAIKWRQRLSAVVDYEIFYDNSCTRFANFFKIYIMLSLARIHHGARFLRTLEGRQLFYTFRNKVCFFCTKREFLRENSCSCVRNMRIPLEMKFFSKCAQRKKDDEQRLDQLLTFSTKLKGPHIMDLGVFIHLSRYVHLGNDLALYIFDFM